MSGGELSRAGASLRLDLNYYGQPVIPPEHFEGEHIANPGLAGEPPVCSCGWTRWRIEEGPRVGEWFEMSDHLADMEANA